MLNHVERGRILEQPAGKDLAPRERALGICPLLDIDLNEGAGLGRAFPRQGPLAGCQPDHHIAHPARFARLEHDILGNVVALVEQAERGDAVLDRGAIFALYSGNAGLRRHPFGNVSRRSVGIAAAVAGRQQQDQAGRKQAPHGQASGLHAS
ncbi:hypothetical protein GCM10023306_00930 [Novosphingobium ginsenosidimutans]